MMADAHELLEMETFDAIEDKDSSKDVEMLDPVLMADSETLCQTISQICALEEQQQPHGKCGDAISFLDEWMEDEIRPPETLVIKVEVTPDTDSRRSSTNSAVEQALYCDDDDGNEMMMDDKWVSVKEEPLPVPVEINNPTLLPSPQPEIDDSDLPAMLDMFSALYSDATAPVAIDEPKPTLSIHIPGPAAMPPAVTYQGSRILAPQSTPNVPLPSYFNTPCCDKSKPPPGYSNYNSGVSPYPMHAVISPTYPAVGTLAARTIVRSRTPKALPRMSMSPDVAEQKLNRIFFQYSDPLTKTMLLAQLLVLLKRHRIKEDAPLNLLTLFPPNDINAQPFPYSLFGAGSQQPLTLEGFQNAFQICNRCTEIKRKQHSTNDARELQEDVAPVIVRVVPSIYEGPKIKSCDHFQWTWCEGFEKTKTKSATEPTATTSAPSTSPTARCGSTGYRPRTERRPKTTTRSAATRWTRPPRNLSSSPSPLFVLVY
ncbi:hypothetical protein SPRG_11838 [Saprolegnia parasitica CBS 223.65]|uniref:Uncharacterized protein n=1 Tax=Saprolegnia parasitica (strain CBS 223.65) TaxID=695850 RepID=A0A067C8V3_SAPPC|nr:hypothetical protein SPRG_11838 [Saprolegnia parasitica CBS 223.65]KDO22991.1 hypothetical protein SPRG_11838 [Saprolegnia parasitica CBS 223.65]|eukprot:XP_012206282.1 hypothetical protein SPRG_11838 [Saprolegnia parasitica CBS 223.65]